MTSPSSGRKERLRAAVITAWEASKPPEPMVLEEELGASVGGWLGRVAQFQEVLASIAFFGTFVTVLAEVVLRLVGHPVVWALELPIYLFIWAFCLSAGLADWSNRHLAFDLIAEKLGPRSRLVMNTIVNAMFVAIFIAVLPGTFSFLQFSATQPSSGLPVSQAWGYAGIVILFGLGAILRARLLWMDISAAVRHKPQPGAGEVRL